MQFIFTVFIPGMRLLGSLKYITHNNINNEAIECSQNNTCLYFLASPACILYYTGTDLIREEL